MKKVVSKNKVKTKIAKKNVKKVDKIKKTIKSHKSKIKTHISHSKSIKKLLKKNKKSHVKDGKKHRKISLKTAMFGAGCFWGIEEAFRTTAGVVSTEVGYAGGQVDNVTYEQVCNGDTGHAEVVKVMFNPAKTNYKELLDIFWRIHDPTQMNRQGPDVGTQYRSVIFYTNDTQKKEAEKSLADEQKKRHRIIATVVEKLKLYVKAEEYHQKYLMKKGVASCAI